MDNLYLIGAIGKNNELGYNNDLIWRIKEDLNFFKEQTMGNYIIMGRNTYLSMPKNLKGRKYIILTSNKNIVYDNAMVFNNKESLLDFINSNQDLIFYVIGGSKIYNLLIDEVNILYLTEIDDSFKDATVYFPLFDKDNYDITIGNLMKENGISYRHNKYVRKKVKYE